MPIRERRQNPETASHGGSFLLCKIIVLVLMLTSGACAPSAYRIALNNINELDQILRQAQNHEKKNEGAQLRAEDGPGSAAFFMEIPRVKARFCLQRAIETYANSVWSTGLDITMLVLAGLGAGAGTSMGAAVAAMDEGSGSRKDIGITSVTTLAAAGAVLGLRAALNLNEIGRTQKIAAARNVNAAINIIERYALADDPGEVVDDSFGTCRDEDINIANSLPGSKAIEPVESIISRAKAEKTEKTEIASTAEKESSAAKAAVESGRKKLEELASEVKKLPPGSRGGLQPEGNLLQKSLEVAQAAQAQLETRAKEAEEKAKIETAKARVATAQADVAEKKAAVMQASGYIRRTVFFLTVHDLRIAHRLFDVNLEALVVSRQALRAAQASLAALMGGKPAERH